MADQLSISSTAMADLSKQLNRSCTTMAAITEDLIEEIFIRLPVKSLLSFKTVSKKWYSRISSDSEFAKRYFKQSSKSIVFFDLDPSGEAILYQCFDDHTHKFNIPGKIPKPCRVLGSANGLICVAPLQWKGCVLWNPVICTCKLMAPTVYFSSCRLSSFYYDSNSDDYKIVGIWASQFAVFSLKNNSWTTKQEHSIPLPSFTTSPIFSNGALHWYTSLMIIIAFDLAKEQLFKIEIPSSLRFGGLAQGNILFDHRGYLCLFDGCSFWAMGEYGNGDSWFEFEVFRVELPAWISRMIKMKSQRITGFLHTISLISSNISLQK